MKKIVLLLLFIGSTAFSQGKEHKHSLQGVKKVHILSNTTIKVIATNTNSLLLKNHSNHSDNQCEEDNDCISVWGDCSAGLGGCHYAVNDSLYNENEISEWVDLWNENDCIQWVCDCVDLPFSECNSGQCELSYCIEPNPAGCQSTGCDDGFECIVDINDCIPSSCWCQEFTGDWICIEDCGGGACLPTLYGDVNFDSFINVSDIVLLINIILNPDINEYNQIADIDLNLEVNILDVVLLVNMILANY